MFKRFLVSALLVSALVLSPVTLAAQAAAQDQSYFTYVSQWTVPRGEWANFEKQQKEDDAIMQKLIADGTIIDFGDARTSVHTEDGYSYSEWFTATSRGNILKALEVLSGGASTSPALVSATRHSDLFLHTIAHGGKSTSGTTGYLRVGFYQAKPGAQAALEAHIRGVIKPFLDRAVADGMVVMYNIDTQDVHTSEPGSFNLALMFADGAALDKFFDQLEAAGKQNPGIGEILDSLTVAKDHRDILDRVTAYQHK